MRKYCLHGPSYTCIIVDHSTLSDPTHFQDQFIIATRILHSIHRFITFTCVAKLSHYPPYYIRYHGQLRSTKKAAHTYASRSVLCSQSSTYSHTNPSQASANLDIYSNSTLANSPPSFKTSYHQRSAQLIPADLNSSIQPHQSTCYQQTTPKAPRSSPKPQTGTHGGATSTSLANTKNFQLPCSSFTTTFNNTAPSTA